MTPTREELAAVLVSLVGRRMFGGLAAADHVLSLLSSQRAEFEAVKAEPSWQDMATAPKDGTKFIGADERWNMNPTWWWSPSSRTFGWRRVGGVWWSPTKWAPLPSDTPKRITKGCAASPDPLATDAPVETVEAVDA